MPTEDTYEPEAVQIEGQLHVHVVENDAAGHPVADEVEDLDMHVMVTIQTGRGSNDASATSYADQARALVEVRKTLESMRVDLERLRDRVCSEPPAS